MQPQKRALSSVVLFAVAFVMVVGLTVFMTGQEAPAPLTVAGPQITGLPDDWTHHHLIFSNPGTEEEALQNGTHDKWLKVVNDPRYVIQQIKRRSRAQGPAAERVARVLAARTGEESVVMETSSTVAPTPTDFMSRLAAATAAQPTPIPKPKGKPIKKDWSTGLDGTAAVGTGTVGAALSSSNITGSSSISIGGTSLAASAPTAASQTGTFSGPPTSSNNAISVVVGSNTLNLSTNATASNATGTFSGPALSSTSIALTSGGNTLTMTPAGTGATATGTVSEGPTTASSISVTSGSNTLKMTTNGTAGSNTGTFTAAPTSSTSIALGSGINTLTMAIPSNAAASAEKITFSAPPLTTTSISFTSGFNTVTMKTNATVVSNTGTFSSNTSKSTGNITMVNPVTGATLTMTFSTSGTNTCTAANTASILEGTTSGSYESQEASSVATAINSTSCQNTYPVGFTATNSGANFTVTAATPGPSTFTGTASHFSWGTASGGSAGSAACSLQSGTSYTGTFETSTSTTTLAGYINTALATCESGAGFSTSTTSNTVTITDSVPGVATYSTPDSTYTWASVTAGINGTAACGGSAPSFTGAYPTGSSATAVAGNLSSQIASCSGTDSLGLTTSYSSGTVTVTESVAGQASFTTTSGTNIFSWTSATAGTNGSATCGGSAPSFTGTFAAANTTALLASNLSAAIAACNTANSAVGISSSYSSGNTFTVTDTTPGNAINTFTVSSANVSGIFSWGSGVTAGTNGSAACSGTAPTFAGTFVNSATANTLAGNFNTALNTGTCPASVGFSTNTSTNTVTVTNTTPGTTTTSPFSVTATNNSGIYTWGAVSGGINGSYSCSGSAPTFTATYATSNSTATLASDLSSAIGSCNASAMGITSSYSSGSIFTVTYATLGTGGNTGTTLTPTGVGPFVWVGGSLTGGTDGTTSGTTFAYWSVNNYVSPAVLASNIATAINANPTLGGTSGVTAVSAVCSSKPCVNLTANAGGTSGNSIALVVTSFSDYTWSGSDLSGGVAGTGKVQPNMYPAKYGVSLTGASCSDYVIYPTGQAGATNTADIIAYDNLYTTGCGSASVVPAFYWGYNTGGTVTTSPILSSDGTQVGFIQVSGTTASLVLLKWAPGPTTTLTSQASGSAYRSCTAPCMYTMALSGAPNDTFSSPFYDYGHDIVYVGDDSGKLHQFSGVFNGSPAESGSPWPVTLTSGNKVSSPVYDSEYGFQGGSVFVGDMGGVFYSVGTGYGGTPNGTIYGNTGKIGDVIADAPLVDASEGEAFVFVTTNGSYSYTGDNGVWQFVSSFQTLGTPGVVYAGLGGSGYYLYDGTFDNVYYESGNPANGNLFVVGNTGTAGGGTLYQLPIAYSSLTGASNPIASGLNSTEHPWPSPVTEFCNNGANPCSLTARTASGTLSTTSPNVTLTSGTFTGADLGAQIWASPSNILYGKVITSVLSSTTADVLYGVYANETGQTFTIQDAVTTSGTDYIFFSINRGTGSGCTNSAGDGCVLSYNVTSTFHAATGKTTSGSNSVTSTSGITAADVNGTIAGVGIPAGDTITAYSSGTATLAVAATASTTGALLTITPLLAQTGSGLNVTTPGTNGCWATSAMVIDNSDPTTTGADQVYFVGLNGASSAATGSNCTSGTANVNGTQAAQSNP